MSLFQTVGVRVHAIRLVALAATAALLILAGATVASADPPGPLASGSMNCADDYRLVMGTASFSRDNTVVRTEVHGGSAYFPDGDIDASDGDVLWTGYGRVSIGSSLADTISCRGAAVVSEALYDVPSTPASYSGVMSGSSRSTLYFNAPATAQYEAAVSLSQGSIDIQGHTLASSGVVDLGEQDQGMGSVEISGNDGPSARYTITIRQRLVVLDGLAWDAKYAKPGTPLKASYTVSGDAGITANVLNAANQVVRVLADHLKVARGDHSLTWDGLDGNGQPVADGNYRVRIDLGDAAGSSTAAEAGLVIDGSAPTVKFAQIAKLRPTQGIKITFSDGWSGLTFGQLWVNGRKVARLSETGGNTIIYRPQAGWERGRVYSLRVRAADAVGNVLDRMQQIQIRA